MNIIIPVVAALLAGAASACGVVHTRKQQLCTLLSLSSWKLKGGWGVGGDTGCRVLMLATVCHNRLVRNMTMVVFLTHFFVVFCSGNTERLQTVDRCNIHINKGFRC
jgi:hypothetical protein